MNSRIFYLIFVIFSLIISCKIKEDSNYFYYDTLRLQNNRICTRDFIRVVGNKYYYYNNYNCQKYWYFENLSDTVDIDLMKEEIKCGGNLAINYIRKKNDKVLIGVRNEYNNKIMWSDLYSFDKNDTVIGISEGINYANSLTFSIKRIFIQDTIISIPNHFENIDCYMFKEIVPMIPIKNTFWEYSFVDKKTLLPIYVETYLKDSLSSQKYLVKVW